MPVRSAAVRRRAAKLAYNVYLAGCPSRQLLALLGNKWVCLVLVALGPGAQRHGQLATKIAGVSQKMLTQTLRELERDGLIVRTITASVPVRVDYELTALGRDLEAQVRELKRWAERNMDTVLAARRRYDGSRG